MNDANLLLKCHSGNGIVDALLYWFGVVEVTGNLSVCCALEVAIAAIDSAQDRMKCFIFLVNIISYEY